MNRVFIHKKNEISLKRKIHDKIWNIESIRTMYSAYFDLDLNSLKWTMLKEDIVALGQNATQLGDFLEIRS